jgi:RNA polymerase sigma-70 factor, ECF subfamily
VTINARGGALDDAHWVRRAQAGDRDAYGELVRRHQRAAIRVAATIAGSDRAADAAQEGFLRAHRSLHRFDPRRPFRPWLLRIVANAAKNEHRADVRHRRLADRVVELRLEPPEPDDPAVRTEEREALRAALCRLSVDDRVVLALRWFEEMSEADMAQVIGVRPGTVKSRLHRALTRLRIELSERDDADD